MCWYSKKLKIKTAKKDISVWKIVRSLTDDSYDNICKSLYKKYTYFEGILVTTPIEFEVRQNGIIGTMGLHSYSNKLKLEKSNDDSTLFVYKKRIFSNLKDYIIAIGSSNVKIARFHIPKGYQYAENRNGEIISSAIVFDSFID